MHSSRTWSCFHQQSPGVWPLKPSSRQGDLDLVLHDGGDRGTRTKKADVSFQGESPIEALAAPFSGQEQGKSMQPQSSPLLLSALVGLSPSLQPALGCKANTPQRAVGAGGEIQSEPDGTCSPAAGSCAEVREIHLAQDLAGPMQRPQAHRGGWSNQLLTLFSMLAHASWP